MLLGNTQCTDFLIRLLSPRLLSVGREDGITPNRMEILKEGVSEDRNWEERTKHHVLDLFLH